MKIFKLIDKKNAEAISRFCVFIVYEGLAADKPILVGRFRTFVLNDAGRVVGTEIHDIHTFAGMHEANGGCTFVRVLQTNLLVQSASAFPLLNLGIIVV